MEIVTKKPETHATAGQTAPFKVGLVTFTETRQVDALDATEAYNAACHQELAAFLTQAGLAVVDPHPTVKASGGAFGVHTLEEVEAVYRYLREAEIDCLVIGCWKWTDAYLAVHLVKWLNLPTCLVSRSDPAWTGATCLPAVGGSLWETAPNLAALRHEQVYDDFDRVAAWARGVAARERLRRRALLLWGGTYCLKMEHLQDDIPRLKALWVGEVLSEGQYILIKKAERLLAEAPARIAAFEGWLRERGAKIIFDERMFNATVLARQTALYLAARERLAELASERIAGVSIKCQPELSEHYGVDACFLPAFLPFGEDHEGPQTIVPTVCEGDIKGLLTSVLLHQLTPGIPPLFGDLKYVGADCLIISNCGASSLFYAANSLDPALVLPRLTLSGQCQGNAGGAVGYRGVPAEATVARLLRIGGHYLMLLGRGEIIPLAEDLFARFQWARMWPLVAVKLNADPQKLMRIMGANHLSLTLGDVTAEIAFACRQAGVPVVRMDEDADLERGYQWLGSLEGWE